MPTTIIAVIIAVFVVIAVGMFAMVRGFLREYGEEKRYPVPAWDAGATQELYLWRQEQEKEKARCPGCGGTQCWDWRREGRSCTENPTFTGNNNPLAEGRHNKHTVRLVPASWWPLPATRMGRVNPDLWAKLLDHAPIVVNYRRAVALP